MTYRIVKVRFDIDKTNHEYRVEALRHYGHSEWEVINNGIFGLYEDALIRYKQVADPEHKEVLYPVK